MNSLQKPGRAEVRMAPPNRSKASLLTQPIAEGRLNSQVLGDYNLHTGKPIEKLGRKASGLQRTAPR